MPEIITRAEARARGLKRYFTGAPCKYGHVCERFIGDRSCLECSNIKSSKYYSSHRDIRKAYSKSYQEKLKKENPEKYHEKLAWNREYYSKNYHKSRNRRRVFHAERQRRKADLIAVLRLEMPELLKEFGL